MSNTISKQNESFKIYPIGYVRKRKEGTCIEIQKNFIPALKELDKFSHAQILWWFNELDDKENRKTTQNKPPYKNAPLTGVFASRSPVRPNLIGLTTVFILNIDHKKGIIDIPFIDANNNTPILDLKPYIPLCDRVKNFRVPEWLSNWPDWIPEGYFDPKEYGIEE